MTQHINISPWAIVGFLACIVGLPLLALYENSSTHTVRLVLLSPAGCQTASQLGIKTIPESSGCRIEQPGMLKYESEVVFSDGKSISATVVTGWSK